MKFVPFLFLIQILLFGVESQKSQLGVKDHANYFSPKILKAANHKIQNIKEKYEIDLFIETYAKVPNLLPLTLQSGNSPTDSNHEHFFDKRVHDWFESKNSKLPSNSIQILIVRNPGYIIVGVGRSMRYVAGFKQKDDNTLTKIMQSSFELGKYDEALLKGLEYIDKILVENMSGAKVLHQAQKRNEVPSKNLLLPIATFFKQWGLSLFSSLLLLLIVFSGIKVVQAAATEA